MQHYRTIKIGTRGSRLARYQASQVQARLEEYLKSAGEKVGCELIEIKTTGDRITDRRLSDIGGKALFTKEIDQALLEGRIDIAVHSIKDIETFIHPDLDLQAALEREDPRDVLITAHQGHTLQEIAPGATLGTASLRRQSQILHLRPDLKVSLLRGNVPTRLEKVYSGAIDLTLLAAAGLKRLQLLADHHYCFAEDQVTPAVGQGGIGLVCRRNDSEMQNILRAINHPESLAAIELERLFLEGVNGDCHTPVGGLVKFLSAQHLQFYGCVATADGHHLWRECVILTTAHAQQELMRLGQEMNQWLIKHHVLSPCS
jgi:hydroxymethylbilane synthase